MCPVGSGPNFSKSSSKGSPDQKDRSKLDASVRAVLNDINFLNIIDHDQNDDPINIIITILTVIVARPKSAQKVKASFSILSAHLFAIFGLA